MPIVAVRLFLVLAVAMVLLVVAVRCAPQAYLIDVKPDSINIKPIKPGEIAPVPDQQKGS